MQTGNMTEGKNSREPESKRRGKSVKAAIIGLAVLIVAAAAVMLFFGGKDSGNEDLNRPDSALEVKALEIDDSADNAKAIYDKKPENFTDTTAVVDLLEAMSFEENCGEYELTIAADGDSQVMSFAVKTPIWVKDKGQFDSNMEIYAEQLMALAPAVGRVEWTYSIISSKAEDETATVSLDTAGAKDELGKDAALYGKSAKTFRQLLTAQSEMNK